MSAPRGRTEGQALLELALVLPLTLLLGCGAVAVVQLARTQVAMETASSAAALVAARAIDAERACQQATQELQVVEEESAGLLNGPIRQLEARRCVGAVPDEATMPTRMGGGSVQIWLGYGGALNSFCRVGGPPNAAGLTDRDVEVVIAYRPDLQWIPLVGGWMSPSLRASSIQKIDPFRSRDPGQDPTGDAC